MIVGQGWARWIMALTPILITGLVLFVTWRQNIWQRSLSERKHQLEVQQLKFALLEKRIAVIETVTAVLARFQSEPQIGDARNEQLFNCLLYGQTLFEAPIAARLQEAWLGQVEYYNQRQAFTRSLPGIDEAVREAKRVAAEELRQPLFDRIQQLQIDMIAATRIEALLRQ